MFDRGIDWSVIRRNGGLDGQWAWDVSEAGTEETARRLRKLAAEGALEVPPPGGGSTWVRWSRLREWGREDLALARLAEGHTDAVAILAEAGRAPVPDALYGVWAARSGSGLGLHGGRLAGTLRFCSGAHGLDRALVVADAEHGTQLLDVDVRRAEVQPVPGTWQPVGMLASDSPDVRFAELAVELVDEVGPPAFYTERPGFWHGGAGVAAVWLGGALGVLDDVYRWLGEHGADPHRLANLGQLHVAVRQTEALLRLTADIVDADPAMPHRAEVGAVRASAEQAARTVLDVAPRVFGAAGLCRDDRIPRRLADLGVYVRQHHGERDLAALGQALLDEWTAR